MKALSVAQPWAEMIIDGVKDIELRSWGPKIRNLPMRIAIVSCIQTIGVIPIFDDLDKTSIQKYNSPGLLPRGTIIGYASIVEAKTYHDIKTYKEDKKRHRAPDIFFKPGIRGWRIEYPHKLKNPKPYKGMLRLFEIPDSELD